MIKTNRPTQAIGIVSAILIAFSTLAVTSPATANEVSNTTSHPTSEKSAQSGTQIVELEAAPEGYWTPERRNAAVNNSTLDSDDAESRNQGTQRQSDPEPEPEFPDVTWESVVQRQIPSMALPTLPPVIREGMEYPPTVGKIFMTVYMEGKDPKSYTCTGTVVASKTESIIITAGHCIWPKKRTATSSHITFVPAYHALDNREDDPIPQFPRGEWDVTETIGSTCWIAQKMDTCDQAFLKVAPRKSDGATLQSVVGGRGLIIGGSPVRGLKTESQPYTPSLTMHSYPAFSDYFPDLKPDKKRMYKCEGASSAASQKLFLGAIQMPCNNPVTEKAEPITGGSSGAALIERTQVGEAVIATFIGKLDNDTPLLLKLNDSPTKKLYQDIDY